MAKTVIVVRLKSENDLPAVISQLYQSGLVDDVRLVRRHDKGEAAEVTVDDSKAFVNRARRGNSSWHTRHHDPNGLTAPEYTLAIMQRKPDDIWAIEDIGFSLATDFDYSANTASAAVGKLVESGYAERGKPGFAFLTKKGKDHPQDKPLDRTVASDEPS